MTRNIIVNIGIFTLIIGCMHTPKEMTEAEKSSYLTLGDSLSAYTQQMLLKNLIHAIEERGTAGAVTFCSESAIPLTNKASETHHVQIQRLSNKIRNPDNALSTQTDRKAWDEINLLMQDKGINPKHWVGKDGDAVYYYKAIPLGMPTCLSCHGNKDTAVEPETLQAISMRYPHDKATGYEMGQLRGIWKVQLK